MDERPRERGFTVALGTILDLVRKTGPKGSGRAALEAELGRLRPESTQRLCTLINMGRALHDLGTVTTSVSDASAQAPLELLALYDRHTVLQQYLERGCAMARASELDLSGLDLTSPSVCSLARDPTRPLYERAWSRFGLELATSDPGDWVWFGRGRTTEQIDKLYLRHGKNPWWSFTTILDRPVPRQVATARRALARSRTERGGPSLEELAGYTGASGRPALRRALSSIQARLGSVGPRRR